VILSPYPVFGSAGLLRFWEHALYEEIWRKAVACKQGDKEKSLVIQERSAIFTTSNGK
jgi:hypothetical protein